jgi:hypothetical protein
MGDIGRKNITPGNNTRPALKDNHSKKGGLAACLKG